MYVNIKIKNITLIALIDYGASGFAFLSESVCRKLNLTSDSLDSSIALIGFEGKSNTKITKQVRFHVSLGNHMEEMSAFVTPQIKYDLVLGIPWLEKHSPYINWKNILSPLEKLV